MLFSTVVVPVYISTSSAGGFPFLQFLLSIGLLVMAILAGMN